LGIPLVTTFHALEGPIGWGRGHRAALVPLFLQSRNIVVCSSRQEQALKRLPAIARKVYRIPLGAGIEPVEPPPHPRKQLLVGTSLRFIYFGFIWRGRGIETLLRTIAALASMVTLEVVGGIRDAEYQIELMDLVRRLGLQDRVSFQGELPAAEVSRHLWEADAALLPFTTGASTGRSSLMAVLAHGLPVVTTKGPG
jgi:glycosyltransferase involved in cell wall biosynthesis